MTRNPTSPLDELRSDFLASLLATLQSPDVSPADKLGEIRATIEAVLQIAALTSPMPDPTPSDEGAMSLAQVSFRRERDLFEAEYSRFLASLATPIRGRQEEAQDTLIRLAAIRLGVLR